MNPMNLPPGDVLVTKPTTASSVSDLTISNRIHHTIIIPTIAKPDVLLPAYRSLLSNLPASSAVVVVLNPVNREDGVQCREAIRSIGGPVGGVTIIVDGEEPVGFSAANNLGVVSAAFHDALGQTVVFYNDDIVATEGWLDSLEHALDADFIQLAGDGGKDGRRRIPTEKWGPIGCVGPVTTAAAGIQGVTDLQTVERYGGHGSFSKLWRSEMQRDDFIGVSFLSGFCMAFSVDALLDIAIPCPVAGIGVFATEHYPIAGYEDNDICIRLRDAGWGMVVDMKNYVGHIGHQSFDHAFPEMNRGMRNRLNYYGAWSGDTQRPDQRLIGVYRVALTSIYDIHIFRESLRRHASLVDGFAILLTNNPGRDVQKYPDYKSKDRLKPDAATFLALAEQTVINEDGTDGDWKVTDNTEVLLKCITGWVNEVVYNAPGNRVGSNKDVAVSLWLEDFNERDERNAAISLGESLNPDWLISFDHDEHLEDRVRRMHLVRLMTHPDPMVEAWQFGWLDHWNDDRHFRTDAPWGDNGNYNGGRRGRRMWKFRPKMPGRIHLGNKDGFHCGNCPDTGYMGNRISGLRFRHHGYTRMLDRHHRYEKYSRLDPNPDPDMIGGPTYGHIISGEGMRMEFFNPHNGICLHMLVYSGTDIGQLSSILDHVYGVVDHIVLVWTDDEPWDESLNADFVKVSRLFKVDAIHHKLRDDDGVVNFGAARNAAIERIVSLNDQYTLGLGWGLFFDPDEVIADPLNSVAMLRRMAESTETYGWMFNFQNPLPDGSSTHSDSVRMHRLEPIMRFSNRVHESFDGAVREIVKRTGRRPIRVQKHFQMMNRGLMDASVNNRKLRMYADGLMADLRENPYNGGAWNALGLQLEAEGHLLAAQACYQAAMNTIPDSFIGYRSLLSMKLRESLALCEGAMGVVSAGHPWAPIGNAMHRFLKDAADIPPNPASEPIFVGTRRFLPAPPPELAQLAPALESILIPSDEEKQASEE